MNEISPVQKSDPRRSLSIKGLMPGLSERGKIKIGMKGAARESQNGKSFQAPQKLDHFVVTTLQRGPDGNFLRDEAVHKRIGDRPTEIPVRLLYDDSELDFQSRYVCFRGQTLWCSGDGDNASRLRQANSSERDIVPCANGGCPLADPAHQDIRYGGRPFPLLSASEQYRVRVILSLAMAQIDGSAALVFDAADVLDRDGRNGLLRLAFGSGMPVLVCMTLPREDADKAATSGKAAVYWLNDGVAERLVPSEQRNAA